MLTENNNYLLKITKKYFLSAITLFLLLPSKRVPTSTSLLPCRNPWFFQTWPFSADWQNWAVFSVTPCIINLFDIFFLAIFPWYIFWYIILCQIYNLYHQISMTMFLKFQIKSISERSHKPKLFLILLLTYSRSQNPWSY